MKNVLLLMHDDAGQEARFQAALDLVRALHGHLRCLDVTLHSAVLADYYGVTGKEMLAADQGRRESKNREAMEVRLVREGVAWDWTDVSGTFVDAIVHRAAFADIIVMNRQLDQFPYPDMRDAASRILMKTRLPMLAVPAHLKNLRLSRALIAWDGRPSCISTMRHCVPVLRMADHVEIFMVRDGSEVIDPEEAALYLSRYGIHGDLRIANNGLHAPDWHIKTEIERFGADFLMMGAYSHGRFSEFFGGVTRRMLGHSKLPLFLGH